jgi:hypothetical protein
VRGTGAGRHVSSSAHLAAVFAAHVQARARSRLAAVVQLRRTRYQVIVNGYTARIAGRYPRSVWKIVLLVLLALLVALAVITFSEAWSN